jgi:hypothetical protein
MTEQKTMEPQFEAETSERFIQQFWDLWIGPAIERRQRDGQLPADFAPYRMQVIFRFGSLPEVRLNEEVRGRAVARPGRPVVVGEEVALDELEALLSVQLTDQDPNAGHFTLIRHRENWVLSFDFRYNAASSRQHAALAREFLNVATYALERGYVGPLIDNLFSATELMAKAELQMHDQTIFRGHFHGERRVRYQRWAETGNADRRYAELLNRLWDLRGVARYLEDGPLPSPEEARTMLDTAEEMFTHLDARIPRRHAG